MVLLSAFAMVGLAAYQSTQSGTSLYRRVWAAGVVSMFLALLADFAPGVAGPFAGLTVLGFAVRGDALANALDNLLGTTPGGIVRGGAQGGGTAPPGPVGPVGTPGGNPGTAPPQSTPPGLQGPVG